MLEFLLELDTKLLLFLNGLHAPTWDIIMYEVSEKEFWYPFYGVLILVMVWRYQWNALATLLFIALLITLSDQISVKAFKEVFERFRPTHNPQIKDLVHTVSGYRGGDFGFVSSHAANTFAMAFFTSKLFKNRYYSWAIFIWAAVVSYSRIYLGVHYPLDIIGGALLGIVLGYPVFQLYFCLGNRYLKKTFYG
ncbi:MAG: phosphatase PAP2 family protein [Bacteroidales bacterium]|nr:phosphatase PAP2 family protein [Bacteroidales bacterium]